MGKIEFEELDIQTSKVISLDKKRIEYGRCKHFKMIVSEDVAEITCQECGEKLNPIWVLSRFAREEKTLREQLRNQLVRLKNIEVAMNRKTRTKCKHCNRYTPVNINLTQREWMGWNRINE